MAHSKNIVSKRQAPLPWSRTTKATGNFLRSTDNQPFYNSTTWRKCAHAFRSMEHNARCACCYAQGRMSETEEVDHIIRIEEGGAKLSAANLQGLCKPCHSRKSAIERHHGILVPFKLNSDGDKIPLNKTDIIERMLSKSDKL